MNASSLCSIFINNGINTFKHSDAICGDGVIAHMNRQIRFGFRANKSPVSNSMLLA